MSTLVCFGLGYCAEHYVAEFGGRFDRIVGTVRGADKAAAINAKGLGGRTVEAMAFDGTAEPSALRAAIAQADLVLVTAPPADFGDPVLHVAADDLSHSPTLRAIVYLSTVGVYGDAGGGFVDETTEEKPLSPRSRARVTAEVAWAAFAAASRTPVAILRLAGIYGPGRNALANLANGSARIIDKPGQVFNRIHVADIAQAIEAAFVRGFNGIVNVSDDEPSSPADPIVYAAGLMGVAPPPAVAFAEVEATMSPMQKSFWAECKRVRNDKLKTALGVRLRYPTYREGLTALHAADRSRH